MGFQQEAIRVCNLTLTTAITGDVTSGSFAPAVGRVESLTAEVIFTYGSGGTNATASRCTQSVSGSSNWVRSQPRSSRGSSILLMPRRLSASSWSTFQIFAIRLAVSL